jgi:hypothetical protein
VRCPFCDSDRVPVTSGPYVTGPDDLSVLYFLCRDCDRYLPGATIPPLPEPRVAPGQLRLDLSEAA